MKKKSRGFTTIEILVVVGILLVLLAMSASVVSRTQVSSQLTDVTDLLVQRLRFVKQQSVVQKESDSYGVFISGNSYTSYKGASYATRDTDYDLVTDTGKISLLVLSGSSDFHFQKGTGIPSTSGTIQILHPVYGTSTIEFNSAGLIYSP